MEVPSCRFRCKMTTRSRMDLFQGPVCCNISGLLSSWAAPPRVQYVSFRDNDCCHISGLLSSWAALPRVQYVSFRDNDCCHICGLLSSWCVWPYTSPVLLCPCRIVCLFFHSVIIAYGLLSSWAALPAVQYVCYTQNAPRWQQFHVAPAMPAL